MFSDLGDVNASSSFVVIPRTGQRLISSVMSKVLLASTAWSEVETYY